jgi:hypothetical protein
MISTRTRITAVPVLAAAGLVSSLPFTLKTVAHQADATPEAAAAVNPFADLGLPQLDLVVTPEGFSGIQESLEAGRYVLSISGEAGEEDFLLGGLIAQFPEGVTIEDVAAQSAESESGIPDVFYETTFAGGKPALAAMGEMSAFSVIDLTPGEWHVLDQMFAKPPLSFTVTGEMPADVVEPEASVTLEMGEMYFEVTEGAFVAGENIVHLFNAGVQPHFAEIMMVPEGTTNENIEAAIAAEMGATPEAEPVDFSQVMPIAFLSEQSEGVSTWSSVTLEAGTYALMCWVADPETGMPHAMMGMHSVVVVE